MSARLKIAIDARITPGKSGGVGQALVSLVEGLGSLTDGEEVYDVVVRSAEQAEWWRPYMAANQRVVVMPSERQKKSLSVRLRAKVSNLVIGKPEPRRSVWPEVPVSNGFYESLGAHVIHFMNQMAFTVCALPTIYNPHDLQHLHLPEFFRPSEIAKRETLYQAGCHFARTVVVGAQWIKDDVVTKYQLDETKVQVIPEHPRMQHARPVANEKLRSVLHKHELNQPFVIYPAVTWEHKNHLRLLEALALLRDREGLRIKLVCTGATFSFWPQIEARVAQLNLGSQVKFLGYVSDEDLSALYQLAQFMIMPTLFEASSLPIFEAWAAGTPVGCSTVTALPDQVLDAALLFDPYDVESIAEALTQLNRSAELRSRLRELGYRRLADFDATRTAKTYRAVYRRAARRSLGDEERRLLSWDWMRNPERRMEVA